MVLRHIRKLPKAGETHPVRRAIIAIGCVLAIVVVGYVSFSKWGIRHINYDLLDQKRDRVIDIDLAVRWDTQMRARAGFAKMPVAVLSHGNTVKYTEYSFLANVLALRGYLVVSIQHDRPTDAELMTNQGALYVGRLQVYERGVANILYTLDEVKKFEPNADYDHLLMIGHSNGGDISMFFAQQHPEKVTKVVTLDNLRVPFLTSGPKILSFRSRDWKPDPGVVPSAEEAKKAGIDIIETGGQHTDMSDRGPDELKSKIQSTLDSFLGRDENSDVTPVDKRDVTTDVRAMGP